MSDSKGGILLLSAVGAVLGVLLVFGARSWFFSGSSQGGVRATQQRLVLSIAQMMPMNGGGPNSLPRTCQTGVTHDHSSSEPPYIAITCREEAAGFGGMYSRVDATEYRGRRIRLSGHLRANEFTSRGGHETIGSLWLRVLAPSGAAVENGVTAGVRSSGDWVLVELFIDVPSDATAVLSGAWMQGFGELQGRDLALEAL